MELANQVAEVMEVTGADRGGPIALGGTDRRWPDIGRLRALGYDPLVSRRRLELTVP